MKRTTLFSMKTRNRKYYKKLENFLLKRYPHKTRFQVREYVLTIRFNYHNLVNIAFYKNA